MTLTQEEIDKSVLPLVKEVLYLKDEDSNEQQLLRVILRVISEGHIRQ